MELDGRVQQRGDWRFHYRLRSRKLFPSPNSTRLGRRPRPRQMKSGQLTLYLDWKDFRADHGSKGKEPLCSEPWKSLYVFNRGIFPCCFGRQPIARWAEQGSRTVEQFVEDTRNGAAFQEIRNSLARGIFPAYCTSSPSCPIVRRAVDEQTI